MTEQRDDSMKTRWSLIQRLKNHGDDRSWQEFSDTYSRLIYSVASNAGLTDAEAKEVRQDTLLAVWQKLGEFEANPEAGSFRSWLLTQTRWRIGDQFRRRARAEARRHHKSAAPDRAEEPSTATEERVADPAGNRLDALWDEEWVESARDMALETLKSRVKPKHYQIFYLLVVKEQPPSQVAKALQVNIGQVYLARHRVGQEFKEALKEAEARMEAV